MNYNVYRVNHYTTALTLLTPLTSFEVSKPQPCAKIRRKNKGHLRIAECFNVLYLFQCDSFSGDYQGDRLQDHGARASG